MLDYMQVYESGSLPYEENENVTDYITRLVSKTFEIREWLNVDSDELGILTVDDLEFSESYIYDIVGEFGSKLIRLTHIENNRYKVNQDYSELGKITKIKYHNVPDVSAELIDGVHHITGKLMKVELEYGKTARLTKNNLTTTVNIPARVGYIMSTGYNGMSIIYNDQVMIFAIRYGSNNSGYSPICVFTDDERGLFIGHTSRTNLHSFAGTCISDKIYPSLISITYGSLAGKPNSQSTIFFQAPHEIGFIVPRIWNSTVDPLTFLKTGINHIDDSVYYMPIPYNSQQIVLDIGSL